MKTVTCAALVAAGLVVGSLGLSAAAGARLVYLASAYSDKYEVGLKLPEGVTCGPDGQVIVGDTGNNRLVRFTYRDRVLVAGLAITVPQLAAPSRVHLNSKGDIFALDSRQRRIVRLGADGQFKSVLAFTGVPAPATVVPKSFAIDAADNLYVLDEFGGRVLVLDGEGRFQRALPLPESARFIGDLGVDFEGNVLLIDSIARRLYSSPKGTGAFAPLGGDLSASVATAPSSITPTAGLILVAEGSGATIDIFGRDGRFAARQLAEGWGEGSVRYPSQICVSDKDQVFIADRDNSRLQAFQLTR